MANVAPRISLASPQNSDHHFSGWRKIPYSRDFAEGDDEERAIAYLRTYVLDDYDSSDAYIYSGWKYNKLPIGSMGTCEYMTAVPHTCASRKRDADGIQMTAAIHARWIHAKWLYHEPEHCSRGSVSSDPFLDKVVSERLQYFASRGESGAQIRDAPSEIPLKKDWAWKNPPFLFNYQKQSQLGYNSSSVTDCYCCPSISSPGVLCRCFDCDEGLSMHSPVWTLGKYSIFVKDNAKLRGRRALENRIELRGEDYLHPATSAWRIRKSSMKPETVSAYLQSMMSGAKQRTPKYQRTLYKGGQQLSHDEEEKPNEWHGWRDIYHRSSREDLSSTKLYLDTSEAVGTNYTEELADKWPISKTHLWALKALTIATHVYAQLDGATISLKVVETPLNQASWLPKHDPSYLSNHHFARPNTLACIAHFESGTILLEPDELDQTLAIASGNSIFVIGVLISDPFEILAGNCVKRIIGNIGRTGICMLVAPFEPKIRPLGNEYNLVEHATYDGKREDNFKGTSLHLSFTNWTLPLEVKGAEGRTIDQEAYLVESVISVLDSGKWVADLDILCIDFEALARLHMSHPCPGHPDRRADYDYTSLDSWEELLDGPTCVGFFRAHRNWAARLAAVSILSQKNQAHCVGLLGPDKFCLECLGSDHDTTGGLKRFESPLPSICID